MAQPVTALLQSAGQTLELALDGEPQVLFWISGDYTAFSFVFEGLASGGTEYETLSAVRTDTGTAVSSALTLSGVGRGAGVTLRASGTDLAAARIRVSAIGSGSASAGIVPIGVPLLSPHQSVTGTVALSGGSAEASLAGTLLPAQPHPVPGSAAPAGLPGNTTPVRADSEDGLRSYDREARDLLANIERWQKRLFFALLYLAGGGAASGLSVPEFLAFHRIDPEDE